MKLYDFMFKLSERKSGLSFVGGVFLRYVACTRGVRGFLARAIPALTQRSPQSSPELGPLDKIRTAATACSTLFARSSRHLAVRSLYYRRLRDIGRDIPGFSIAWVEAPSFGPFGGLGLPWEARLPSSLPSYSYDVAIKERRIVPVGLKFVRDRKRLDIAGYVDIPSDALFSASILPHPALQSTFRYAIRDLKQVTLPAKLQYVNLQPMRTFTFEQLKAQIQDAPPLYGLARTASEVITPGRLDFMLDDALPDMRLDDDYGTEPAERLLYKPLTWEEHKVVTQLAPKMLALKLYPEHTIAIKRLFSRLPTELAESYLVAKLPGVVVVGSLYGTLLGAVASRLAESHLAWLLFRRRKTTWVDYYPLYHYHRMAAYEEVVTLCGCDWRA